MIVTAKCFLFWSSKLFVPAADPGYYSSNFSTPIVSLPNHAGRPLYSENGRVECTLCNSHVIFLHLYPPTSGARNQLYVVFRQDVNNLRVCVLLGGFKAFTNLSNRSFIAGGVAACGAVTVTHGFETVKIR